MTIILVIAVIVLVLWVGSISNRLAALERRSREGGVKAPDAPVASRTFPQANKPIAASEVPAPPVLRPVKTEAENTETALNILNRVGVVAVVLGVAFFFKYAIDQGWINEWMRVLIGFIVGVLLMVLGRMWKQKYGSKASALAGGGIAILYFTIYAGYHFYHLFSQPVAFFLMFIVAAVSVWMAFIDTSMILGILGFFGAYGAPVLLGSGRDQYSVLFSYLVLLNAAVFVILFRRFWTGLLALALFGTAVDFLVWGINYSRFETAIPAVVFATIVTVIFTIGMAALTRYHYERKTIPEGFDKNAVLYVLFGVFYFLSTSLLLYDRHHGLLMPMSVLGALIFFIAYTMIDRLELRMINYCLSFAGSALLVIAALWKYNGSMLGLALFLIAALGFGIAYAVRREELRFWAVVILFVSLFDAIILAYDKNYVFLFNAKFGLLLANAAALMGIAQAYKKLDTERERAIRLLLIVLSSLTVWLAVSMEIVKFYELDYAKNARNLMLSFWWIIWATVLMITSGYIKSPLVRKIALGLFTVSIVKVFVYDSQALDTPYRVVSFIVLGVILLSVSFAYQKNKEKITEFLEGNKTES